MITERTLDVFTRNGETRFGTRVWDDNPNIGVGEKVYAGIAHIFNGLIPTISPVKLNPRTSFSNTLITTDFYRRNIVIRVA